MRALGPADGDAYRALRQRGLAEHPEAFTSSADEEAAAPIDRLARRLAHDPARPHDVVFGAFLDDTLAGACGVEVDMRAKVKHKGHVFGMYVPAERSGRRLGGALIDRVVEHARAAGLRQLALTVTAENIAARRVYERAGFAVCGREPQAIRVGERAYDKLAMILFLPAARDARPSMTSHPEKR
ncbi:MAG: GNAT family N-acetyltransferase [Betaproteobacteria bacterium]